MGKRNYKSFLEEISIILGLKIVLSFSHKYLILNMKVLVAQSCSTLQLHGLYVACQVPLFMGFPRQEYWSGLPFLSPGDLPKPGIETESSTLQADSLLSEPPGKSQSQHTGNLKNNNQLLLHSEITGESCSVIQLFLGLTPQSWSLSGLS